MLCHFFPSLSSSFEFVSFGQTVRWGKSIILDLKTRLMKQRCICCLKFVVKVLDNAAAAVVTISSFVVIVEGETLSSTH